MGIGKQLKKNLKRYQKNSKKIGRSFKVGLEKNIK